MQSCFEDELIKTVDWNKKGSIQPFPQLRWFDECEYLCGQWTPPKLSVGLGRRFVSHTSYKEAELCYLLAERQGHSLALPDLICHRP